MRLTQFTDYAIRVLIHAALNEGQNSTVSAIATGYGISRNHLLKVVKDLAKLGYIETTRGKHGGVRLARRATDIRLGQLVMETEGDMALVECLGPNNRCPITGKCGGTGVLEEALAAFIATLDRYTLADILQRQDPMRAVLGIRQQS